MTMGVGVFIGIPSTIGAGGAGALCSSYLTTPVDATVTVQSYETVCSSGAMEIDSVAAGAGVMVVNGTWRLT